MQAHEGPDLGHEIRDHHFRHREESNAVDVFIFRAKACKDGSYGVAESDGLYPNTPGRLVGKSCLT